MSEGIDLIQAARIIKSNGTDGELLAGFRDIMPEDIDIQEPVFIYSDGLPVPFFIEKIVPRGRDKALLRLVDIHTFEDAEELAGQAVYVDAGDYEDVAAEDEGDFSMLEGWTLCREDGTKAGTITDYEDIPGNPCLYVDTENGQVMIPLHEELVLSVDNENQVLTMRVPDGLL